MSGRQESDTSDLLRTLRAHGLEGVAEVFESHGVDVDLIPDLTAADMREMGLTIGDRKRLERLQEALRAGGTEPAPRPHEPERRQITVLFADLVGSTPLSVSLDPEDMRSVIRGFHDALNEAVEPFDAYVAQHLGDGAVVYFGWPSAHEDDVERAVRAALALMERVAKIESPSPTPLQTRVGIATGPVVVGDLVENEESRERPVIGRTPNLAARLERLAEPGQIVISDTTRRVVGQLFELTDLGLREIKGFSDPVRAWRVEGESSVNSRFAALRGSSVSPLVGRELEVRVLQEAWAFARQGEARVVHLVGEAGIGKSRLVRWMRDTVLTDGGADQVYYSSPYHSGSAFYPLIRHLEARAGVSVKDDPAIRWSSLREVVAEEGLSTERDLPVLAKLLAIPPPPDLEAARLEPIQEKEIVLDSMVRRVRAASAERPLLVVMEDLHWCDPSTNELIERVIAGTQDHRVLILACYRPDFEPPWPTDGHMKLELGRLAPDSCQAIITALTASRGLDETVVRKIVDRTDGVPLFVEELTKVVLEAYSGPDPTDGKDAEAFYRAIPETLHDSLLARLDRLDDAKHVAQVASCIGREFTRPLLCAVVQSPQEEVDDALRRFLESNLIHLEPGLGLNGYSFRHALLQDAAYESLLKTTRSRIHERIADALTNPDFDAAPEILAHHYGKSGQKEKEADHWLQAGQKALGSSAFLEAIQHFSAGLAAVDALPEPDPARELALRVLRAVPLTLTRGWAADAVGDAYARAHELCRILGESAETFPTLVGIFTYHLVRGELEYAHELAIDNEEVADASGRPDLILEAAHDRGTSSFYRGRFDEAVPYLQRTRAMYDPERHAHHKYLYNKLAGPTAAVHEMMWCAVQGRREAAEALHAEAARWAEEGDHPFTRVWVMTGLSIVQLHMRDAEAVGAVAQTMIAESQELGFPNWLAQGLIWGGWAAASRGEGESGVASVRQGLEIWSMTGARLMKPYLTTVLVDTLIQVGDLGAAEDHYSEVVNLMDETGERWCAAEVHRLGAAIARGLEGPDSTTASQRSARALSIARKSGAHLYELTILADLARVDVQEGRDERASAQLAPALERFAGADAPVFRHVRAILDGDHA